MSLLFIFQKYWLRRLRDGWLDNDNKNYLACYYLYLIFHIINLGLIIFMTNWCLDLKFLNLVPGLLQGQDTISTTFPTEVPCKYRLYGQSGSRESTGANCLLPINIINDKIFVALYIWYAFLIIVLIVELLTTIILSNKYTLKIYLLFCRQISRKKANYLLNKYQTANIFLLLKSEIDDRIFDFICKRDYYYYD